MPRKLRTIIPDIPHHIVQRGSRKDALFFCSRDRQFYKELLAHYCAHYNVRISAYCMMSNHIHLIARPADELGLSKAIGIAHSLYSKFINQKMNLSGHLWEGRFHSYPMSENHFLQAARYIERNPVAAGMVQHPSQYRWSSCNHHLNIKQDFLVTDSTALLSLVESWRDFVEQPCKKETEIKINLHIAKGNYADPL